jgi:hypothetical protein
MKHSVAISELNTETIELPQEVAGLLKSEAQRSKLSIAEYLMQWLEDQVDGREAARRSKLLKSGKTKAIPAQEVYADLGI